MLFPTMLQITLYMKNQPKMVFLIPYYSSPAKENRRLARNNKPQFVSSLYLVCIKRVWKNAIKCFTIDEYRSTINKYRQIKTAWAKQKGQNGKPKASPVVPFNLWTTITSKWVTPNLIFQLLGRQVTWTIL